MRKIKFILICFILVICSSATFAKNTEDDFESSFSKLSIGDKITFGTWYNYRKYGKNRVKEPIVWKVISYGRTKKAYKYTLISDAVVNNEISFAKVNNGVIEPGTWDYKNSNVRDWLLNVFYEEAFTSSEKEYMINLLTDARGIDGYIINSDLDDAIMEKDEDDDVTDDKVSIPTFDDVAALGCKVDTDDKGKKHIYYDFNTNDGLYYEYNATAQTTTLESSDHYSYWILNRGYTNYKNNKGNVINHPRAYVNGMGIIAGLRDETSKYITTDSYAYAARISPEYEKHGIRAVIRLYIPRKD